MLQIFFFLLSFCVLGNASFEEVDALLEEALTERTLPGGVLVVAHKGETLKEEAYGASHLETVYDIASLTKIFTATAVMILEEEGKLHITDKLSDFYPEFRTVAKSKITIEDLLRHVSGLPAGTRGIPGESYDKFISRVLTTPLQYQTNAETVYSDLGFIILGDLVQKVSGKTLHDFVSEKILKKLGMNETGYYVDSCAPTTSLKGCIPHDPKARAQYPNNLGHAGLFSTATDMMKFAEIYLNKGKSVLSENTINRMTKISGKELRGLGWDLLSPYANPPRGEVFPKGLSFGHTGYTGTTMWIDPVSESYYVFLSNRVYLGEDRTAKPFTKLRKDLSTAIGKVIYSTSSTEETLQ